MLSFTGSLSPDYDAFAIFVTEKYQYRETKGILSDSVLQKINSFLNVTKAKKKDEEIISFDVSSQQKCFIIKVKSKYEDSYPQEIGAALFSNIKKNKEIKKIAFFQDSLDLGKENSINFFAEFMFGFNLKSYTINKYKTSEKSR